MRTLILASATLVLVTGVSAAQAASYCKAFTQPECTADKGCAWRAERTAGDINPRSGKPYKRGGKAACAFSPKDAQAILAKQFGKK